MYIVIQIRRPLSLFRNPHHTVSSICFDDYHHNRLQSFTDRTEAENYIEAQQDFQQSARLNFLILVFNIEFRRNLLINALQNRDHDAIKRAIDMMILFNSSSQPQVFNHTDSGRNNYAATPVTQVSNRKRKAPDEFSLNAAKDVPANFNLAENVLADLKNKKYTDPISQEEIDINGIQFACVPIKDQNGNISNYQIYKKEDLIEHIKTNAIDPRKKVFKDINTNIPVRTNDVFTLNADQIYDFFFAPKSSADPRRKTMKI